MPGYPYNPPTVTLAKGSPQILLGIGTLVNVFKTFYVKPHERGPLFHRSHSQSLERYFATGDLSPPRVALEPDLNRAKPCSNGLKSLNGIQNVPTAIDLFPTKPRFRQIG